MRRVILSIIFIFLFIPVSVFSQYIIYNNGEDYKYFPGISEPSGNWIQKGFDDSGWQTGFKSIGYGDGDDSTVVSKVPSVYVRMKFDVDNTEDFQDLNLMVDYDDGFVAYLNGTEIVRVNMGEKGQLTTYDQLTDRSHEADNYRQSFLPINGFFIPSDVVQSLITTGINVLAIEVHNDSINGSDLSLSANLVNVDWGSYFYENAEDRFKKLVKLDSTLLPIFIVETDEMGFNKRWLRYPATMSVIHNNEGRYNKPDDAPEEYNGRIELEIRGQSSSEFPRRSFRLETQDEDGNDTSVAILGLPEENDYILFAPFQDKSLMRNPVVYAMGNKLGEWNPRTRMCELILNGQYEGVYNFIETIKRDKNRIDIAKLKEDENSGVDLTGGYIMKYDKDASGVIIVYPDDDDITTQQSEYIRSYLKTYHDVLFSDKFLDPVEGYWRYMDPDTYIDYVIMSEITKNADAYLFSTYFYKDKDDKDGRLKFGPIWDNDLGFGNTEFQNGQKTDGWQFNEPSNSKLNVKRIFQDIYILQDFQDRWFELREGPLHKDSIYALIDNYVDELDGAWQRNYETWPLIDVPLFFPGFIPYVPESYENEIEIMKGWISDRVDWIDENITEIFYEYVEYPPLAFDPLVLKNGSDVSVYPNPFENSLSINFKLEEPCNVSLILIDINGERHYIKENEKMGEGEHEMFWDEGNNLLSGIYMLHVIINDKIANSIKVIKL